MGDNFWFNHPLLIEETGTGRESMGKPLTLHPDPIPQSVKQISLRSHPMDILYILMVMQLNVYFILFWLHRSACGILVPQPGIEPVPPAVEVWSLNHWTIREVP